MKKALFLLAAVLITLSAGASSKVLSGTAPSLQGVTKINLKFDYSNLLIEKKAIADWLEYRQATQPNYDAEEELEKQIKPNLQEKIIDALNSKLEKQKAFVTTNGSADYTIVVRPLTINKNGTNTNTCCILDKDGNVLVEFSAMGKGGKWGSLSNLVGDGYKNSGKEIASFVAKCFNSKTTTY